eukprot:1159294-Pelagomonas_calceolata.AAC.8
MNFPGRGVWGCKTIAGTVRASASDSGKSKPKDDVFFILVVNPELCAASMGTYRHSALVRILPFIPTVPKEL